MVKIFQYGTSLLIIKLSISRKVRLSHFKVKKVTTNSKEFLTALQDLYNALVSIDEKNRISEFANCEQNVDFLYDKISIELYAKLKDMAFEVLNMPSRWSGDLEEAMRIDILTSKIEPLWENFDSEWKKNCN
tara:strand:- start:386 stop:781 length:396 start_codon:yes stop_codon:yes gene_type:complete